ncbi:MAG TPA: hypothetical protein VGV64_00175 [Thermoplasmata archaeon]|nr:hypothetical protein [Thermoplasmata archaeon]
MPDAASNPALEQIATQVLTKTLRLRRGQCVLIDAWTHMMPWAQAFVLSARRLGIRPTVLYEDEATYWRSVESARAEDVGAFPEPERAALSKTDGFVFLWGPEDRPRLRALPKKVNQALTGYNGAWYQTAAKAKIRGCRIEFGQATAPAARLHGVDLGSWRNELLEASLVDPLLLQKEAARLAGRLKKGKRLTIHHANGTHLELALVGRAPVVDDGIVAPEDVRTGNNMTSIPAGAVYVAVDERTADGLFVANRTSFPTSGPTQGGRWTMEGGRLTQFTYGDGLERFQAAYDAAGRAKDRPGFVSIGLNPRLHLCPGLEDFERGTLLFGIGANGSFGGKNPPPFQAWLGLAGAHLDVDGRPLVADGEIL